MDPSMPQGWLDLTSTVSLATDRKSVLLQGKASGHQVNLSTQREVCPGPFYSPKVIRILIYKAYSKSLVLPD